MGNIGKHSCTVSITTSHPRVHGEHLLTRRNAQPIHIFHSLYAMDESRIFLDGDPQASLPNFPGLDTFVPVYTLSHLS